MNISRYFWYLTIIILFAVFQVKAQTVGGAMKFSVSMENPNTHYYHITLTCEDVKGEYLDFKLPAWTPGYYWLVNFARNVVSFRAETSDGKLLSWQKTTKNTWRVTTKQVKTVTIRYDVYANTQSVADPFLDEARGYISPAGVFMYIDGALKHPSTIEIKPYKSWNKITTGLDLVPGKSNTYIAPDFDVLYDSPILVGNQEILSFDVQGIPHFIAFEEPEKFNKQKLASDLKQMIESAVKVVNDIPYKHYTFIIMGEGRGGLEHSNSTAVFSNGAVYNNADTEGYKRWLNFLTHEYFHLYNIKSIRPIALGPFNYDQENYTNMLWVSEGFTVYYEYLILNRAGLISRNDVLKFLQGDILQYENIPGRLFQSATESSFDTWIQFFNRSDNTANTTISYYNKGAVLGMLLDLKIRHETKNRKSLDDVMRSLYTIYFKEKQRGFTDDEFRQTCETVAGTSLQEIFEYASTTQAIDYSKYLAYAGLSIDVTPDKASGGHLGVSFQNESEKLIVSQVEWNSPAWHAGLSSQDIILKVNEQSANRQNVEQILKSSRAGDVIKLQYTHRGRQHDVAITVGESMLHTFEMAPFKTPDALQALILKDWLRN
ncbi:M61 family metallopeptidase [Ohtaekwangia koreensis]|uniref:Predicted metalloprotease, contains C-terminal PDZ domain n=1 Tax=Ohtaekwangia koreensis TaxID=688867 RepID=A0A1T5MDB0_9BACT|nr:PDZ domain-containing protein [Ohtaekwangia koreensis]SKC86083.1 Predicted metalloprotease, contains C-terminal PDZ domain [Ohtaekwangia koreensis]